MTTQLATIQSQDLLTGEDLEVLKNSKFKGFSAAEIKYAAKVSHHLSLNPLLNQIHFVKRGDVITTQVGIDGFRLAAERTGKYAGSDDAVYEEKNGLPIKATVTVFKMVEGTRVAFTASARWSEYFPGEKLGHMWKKMPYNQLAKCAEALALRKAFPAELSALRTDEEMAQASEQRPSKASQLNSRQQPIEATIEEAETLPNEEEDLGSVVCMVGQKFKGQMLRDIPTKDLKGILDWAGKQASLAPSIEEFCMKVNAFLQLNGGIS